MSVKKYLVALRLARDEDLVPDTRRFDDHMVGPARRDPPADGRDQARVSTPAATAAVKCARPAWQSAIATASATLSSRIGRSSRRTRAIICCTCFLSAAPFPVTAILTSEGVYSAISIPARP